MTFACATTAELRAARRAGAHAALVGLGAANGVPDGPVVSFGLAGALRDDLPSGTVLDATRVVDESGAVLWEGGPLGAASARPGTHCRANRTSAGPWASSHAVQSSPPVMPRLGRVKVSTDEMPRGIESV